MKTWLIFIPLVISSSNTDNSNSTKELINQPRKANNKHHNAENQERGLDQAIARRQPDAGKKIDIFESLKNIDLDMVNDFASSLQISIPDNSILTKVNDEAAISEAKDYLYMAGISYFNSKEMEHIKCAKYQETLKVIEKFETESYKLKAVLLEEKTKKELIISFRGANDNGQVFKLVDTEEISFNKQSGQFVHKQSMEFLNLILPRIIEKLRSIDFKKYERLVLVGHSMGGSLAFLSSFEINKQLGWGFNKLAVFTYSQPKVGNQKFIEYANSLPMKVLRVLDKRDFVPKFPPSAEWAHTKRVIELDERTNVQFKPNSKLLKQCVPVNSNKRASIHSMLWGVYVGTNKCIA